MTRSRPFVRGLLVTFLLAGLLAEILMPTLASVRAAPQIQGVTHIVISQVYGGGGNSGATYKNDFIELYNPSASSVDVTGWSVQYASSAGDTWQKTDLSGVIQPGKYYLIQEAAGSGGSVDLPTPDATGSIHMATDTGKAALVNNSTILNVACPSGLVDFVGYGSGANCFEGTNPTGTLSNTTAALRKSNGATDTDDNAADFTVGIPNPRNSSTQLLLISEVAWAGTAANTDHEWIELHNPGSQAINLSGWKLNAADGTPNIALNGTVPAMGYFLLERDEDAVSDIVADQLYSDNTLSNSGESLMLYDNNDVLIDTANANGGSWPAGDLSAHATMERIGLLPDSDSSWFTNNGVLKNGKDANGNPILGTPKSGNSPTPTPTPVPPTATFTLAPTFTSTLAFSSDEWIELYNPGAQPIDLSGWKLYATDGSPTINLTGTILAGGYFVLASSSSSVFDDLTPQQTFSGSLNNAGEILRLIDSTGALIDTANSDGGSWPAGVASPTYASMERRGVTADVLTSWSTYADTNPSTIVHDHDGNIVKGTPGKANWGPTVTLTPSPVPTATEKVRPPTPIPPTPFAHVVINEFLPRAGFDWNNDGVVDVNDEFIEIENLGPINVNLSGWKLSDDPNIGGKSFALSGQTLQPGQRAVFYGSTTHILLMDSGDTIRLTNPSGVIVDARGYGVVKYPDQSHCRIPDGNGYWQLACFPTPGNENVLTGVVPVLPPAKIGQPAPCLLPDTAPLEFRLAVCSPFGADIWNRKYWDDAAGQDQFVIPDPFGKGEIVVE